MSLTSMDKNFLTKDISGLMCMHEPTNYQRTQCNIRKYLEKTLDGLEQSLVYKSYNTLVLTIVWETCDPIYWKDGFQQFLTQLKQRHSELKIIVIFESWFKPFQLYFTSVDEVCYIDFWVYKVYESLIIQRTSVPATEWDSTSQTILFMTGKPNKIHRTRLLYKLLTSEIKNCLAWSYKVNQNLINESLTFLNDLSPEEQTEFLNLSQRDLDGQLGSLQGHSGTKFNTAIYKDSLLQIISETDFDRPLSRPFITEKTWVSIVNHRPFIIASELGHLADLNSRGLRTFTEYLAIANYDNPNLENFLEYSTGSGRSSRFFCTQELKNWKSFYQNFKDNSWEEVTSLSDVNKLPEYVQRELHTAYQSGYYSFDEIRLDAIVENAIFFKKNATKNATQINEDVKHNFRIFLELAKNAQIVLDNLCLKHHLVCKNLYEVFELFIHNDTNQNL